MNIPKNDPYSAKEIRQPARSDDNEDDAPKKKPKKARRRMTLEMKLGVAFVLALLTVFCVVLGVRLAGAGKDEAKVELNLAPATEAVPEPPSPIAAKPPQPTIVTERNPPPAVAPPPAFASQQTITPPNFATPPAVAPPPAAPIAAAPPAMTTPTTTIPPSSPPTFAGDRYAVATAGGSATPASPGNPLRVAATSPATTPTSPYGTTATSPEPSRYTAPSGGDRYAPGPPVSSGLTNVGAPAALPPAASLATTSPATSEPRPFNSSAATAQPIGREPGVAAIGATSGFATPPTVAAVAVPPAIAVSQPTAAVAQAQPYVVAPNDSFWSIAEKAYGDGSYYRALYAFNSDRYPHAEDVRTGSVIDVPSADLLKAKFPELCGPAAGAVVAGGESPAMTGRAGVAVAARTYVVQDGDTLFDIARRQLGKASYWSEIYNLNRAVLGENLERLQPGTELMLPAVSPVGQ